METKSKRNSAIELLRIFGMVSIIMFHYSSHYGTEIWSVDAYSLNVLLLQLMRFGGHTANNIFLLITGYYMICSKVNYKKIVILLAELFFYSWLVATVLFTFQVIPFSIKAAVKAAFPIWFGYNWYVCCYIIFCCFVPFLNQYLNSIDKKTYLRLLLIALFIWSFGYTFGATTYMEGHKSVDHFIIIYMLGGYIRLHGIEVSRIKSWWKIFCTLLVLQVSSIVFLSLGGYFLKSDFMVKNAVHFVNPANILDVMTATALFLAVIHTQPISNKSINAAGESVVGIFLIHYNPLLRQVIWDMIFPNVEYINSPFLILHMLIKVTAVFFLCLFIDQMRILFVEKPFVKWLDRKWEPFQRRIKIIMSKYSLL